MWNNPQGEFVRYTAQFRNRVKEVEGGRYHLYISWACPWAHRTAIVRSLLGLEDAITLSAVDPVWNEKGWTFTEGEGCIPDFVNHQRDLIDIYRMADPNYDDEETTPVLWDRKARTIVNNESLEIIQMFATDFLSIATRKTDLYPKEKRKEIDLIIAEIYPTVNNGVYRAGFATSQEAYETAYQEVFGALDALEKRLSKSRYLCGRELTLADICLFTTLFRFDLVYYSHFKCNRQHLYEFPTLWAYVRDIYQIPGVSKTCYVDHIKRHYYISQKDINPTQIVPTGPVIDFLSPHGRERL
jgi:putative glutathione S-transferase